METIRAELAAALGLRKTAVEVSFTQVQPYEVTLKAVTRKFGATAVSRIAELVRVHGLAQSQITGGEDGLTIYLSREIEICVEGGCR